MHCILYSTLSYCWSATTPTQTSLMILMEWCSCGTSNSRRIHQTTSSTVRYAVASQPDVCQVLCPSLQSAVMSVAFSKFHPSYIIGGTYSGQLVLWDLRSGKRTPVQRSPLTSSSHTHPVYCLDVVGTENAHNLISASTDGRLCSWNLDNLSQPQVLP